MKGIYYKDGIYVVIDNDEKHEDCVYHNNYKNNITLFGGRVHISSYANTAFFLVEDIPIVEIRNDKMKKDLSISAITSHLNAIEVNGVDAFIENYKKSVEFTYNELKDLNQKTELELSSSHNDLVIKKLIKQLTNIRELLFSVLAILFQLYSYMSAGLENEKVISVYQSIIDTFA